LRAIAAPGCQVGWLARRHYYRDATPDTAVILIHAVNPFGFAWGRRVTEENVDLNRNFVDFSKPLPANPDYEALAEHINPREWSEAALAAANQAIARYYKLPNADFLPRAIHRGQFVNDKGTYSAAQHRPGRGAPSRRSRPGISRMRPTSVSSTTTPASGRSAMAT